MTPKIENFGQKYAHFGSFEGSFWTILGVKKVVFWTFSKLFGSCLGSVWALFSVLKVSRLIRVKFQPYLLEPAGPRSVVLVTSVLAISVLVTYALVIP